MLSGHHPWPSRWSLRRSFIGEGYVYDYDCVCRFSGSSTGELCTGSERIDRDVFKNKKKPKPPGLTDCVKKYLSKFFDPALLGAITWEHGIPWYVPMDARAFTLDDHIYFGEGEYTPLNGISDFEMELLGHEITHSRQYRQNGSLRQKGNYLLESAKKGITGAILEGKTGMPGLAWNLSYFGNKFEGEAWNVERSIQEDLAKNGNPCR